MQKYAHLMQFSKEFSSKIYPKSDAESHPRGNARAKARDSKNIKKPLVLHTFSRVGDLKIKIKA